MSVTGKFAELETESDALFDSMLRSHAGSAALVASRPRWRALFDAHLQRRTREYDYSFKHRDFGGEGNRLLSLLPLELQDWYAMMPRGASNVGDGDGEEGGSSTDDARSGVSTPVNSKEHAERIFARHFALLCKLLSFLRAEAPACCVRGAQTSTLAIPSKESSVANADNSRRRRGHCSEGPGMRLPALVRNLNTKVAARRKPGQVRARARNRARIRTVAGQPRAPGSDQATIAQLRRCSLVDPWDGQPPPEVRRVGGGFSFSFADRARIRLARRRNQLVLAALNRQSAQVQRVQL